MPIMKFDKHITSIIQKVKSDLFHCVLSYNFQTFLGPKEELLYSPVYNTGGLNDTSPVYTVFNYRQVTELQRSLNVKNAILLVTFTDNYSSQVPRLSKSTAAANISRKAQQKALQTKMHTSGRAVHR